MRFKDTEYGDLTGQHYAGDIDVSRMGLTSLEGAPESVDGGFECRNNELKTLEFAPRSVGGHFNCLVNDLESLEGAPESVGGSFVCCGNKLKTLEFAPKTVEGRFICAANNLTLKGTPETAEGGFDCYATPNPHLEKEWKIRKKNPELSEYEIKEIMYRKTEDERYLNEEIKNMFLF